MKKIVGFLTAFLILTLASCTVHAPETQTVEVDETGATVIVFDGDTATVTGTGASANGTDVVIEAGGTYAVRGETDDGRIAVNAQGANVTVILDGARIACSDSSAICFYRAKNATVCAKDGTNNTLSDGENYACDDSLSSKKDAVPDACLYADADLTLAGKGTLTVSGNAANGIKAKGAVLLDALTLTVNAADKGVKADTDITVNGGRYTFDCTDDALHAGKDLTVRSGEITITSGDDAIHAENKVEILGGDLQITAHEGVEGTLVTMNGGKLSIQASDDGINAAQKTDGVTPTVRINGGEIDIRMGPGDTDGVDSNGDIIINGGTIRVTGRSAFDFDGKGEINGGEVYVNGEKVTTLPNQFFGMNDKPKQPDGESPEPPKGEPPQPLDGKPPEPPEGFPAFGHPIQENS